MATPQDRLERLRNELPSPPKPQGLYVPAVHLTEHGLLYISGHGPTKKDGGWVTGKVGADCTTEDGRAAARLTALAMLATIESVLGNVNRVKRVVKSLCMVNAVTTFTEHITVANGYAEVMQDVFGSSGVGSRSAVGMGSLPSNIPFEVEALVEVEQTASKI
mmetsp:Transcript_8495/g.21795  ORF Transcript_8495/g.21795 Transcript_8495/m.21795 type:complete len:162 (+) Transcript_8495:182-667(+)